VLVGEALGTFQLHHQNVFDQEIGEVFSGRVALVGDGKRSFGGGPDASQGEFSQQSTLADLFKESGAKRVGDFEHGPKHVLGIYVCVICVHPRSSAAYIVIRQNPKL
jgi:hypothetical protein